MAQQDDSLGDLEERIRRTVDLVTSLRAERDAAVAALDATRTEVAELREERQKVRVRIEKLLGQMELVNG